MNIKIIVQQTKSKNMFGNYEVLKVGKWVMLAIYKLQVKSKNLYIGYIQIGTNRSKLILEIDTSLTLISVGRSL